MTAFHDVRLPLAWSLGARGGPERRTDVLTLGSGAEARSSPWAHSRRRYDIAGTARPLAEIAELLAFFEARRGRLHAFRFRDLLDWRSGPPGAAPTAGDQALGTGDGARTRFALTKSYGTGAEAYLRAIRRPVAESLLVAVAGVPLAGGAFAFDAATGEVALSAPPAPGSAVTAGFAFDVPVRFDADRLEAALEGPGAGRILAAPLLEVLS